MNFEVRPTPESTFQPPRLKLPRPLRRFATELLDQQMWCFGLDISRAPCNALLDYGFEKIRAPLKQDGSPNERAPMYMRRDNNGSTTALWGFGVMFGGGSLENNDAESSDAESSVGGVYINRHRFQPHYTPFSAPPKQTWKPLETERGLRLQQLLNTPVHRTIVAEGLRQLAEYEEWLTSKFSCTFRTECIRLWQRPMLSGESTAQAWRDLATWFGEPSDENLQHLARHYQWTLPKARSEFVPWQRRLAAHSPTA